jgi:glyoxylase-like metal-dependent hydrolase (beta-lactamase superfamily II)
MISKFLLTILLQVIIFLPAFPRLLSESVTFISGAVNGVVINRNGNILVIYGDPRNEVTQADKVLFTHFRRDVTWAGRELVMNGASAVAPADEKAYFVSGDSIWTDYLQSRYINMQNQSSKISLKPINIAHLAKGGEHLRWQDLDIRVIDTPGYTRGSVTYIIRIDNKKYAFTGDLIYDGGKIPDLYSFQDSYDKIAGYHGYATRLGQLIRSLQLIEEEDPDYIVPSRGPVITDLRSLNKLTDRIRSFYKNYLSVTAYRWYYPERTEDLTDYMLGTDNHFSPMPYSSLIKNDPYPWSTRFNTVWLVFAKDSSAFLMDCGSKAALNKLKEMKESGRIKSLDGIFITHYHSDHVTFINEAAKEFNCPVYITRELKDILENPSGYNMPALIKEPITNLRVMRDGEKMFWKDYTLTFRYFPGQTLYHDAVLFENQNGESIFFAGDSFTPSGIDDYCLLNRNFLNPGTGYFYCLDLLRQLPDNVLLANQHVDPLFSFSQEQLEYLTDNLIERRELLQELLPWENINYGIDEQWVRFYPYEKNVKPGSTHDLEVIVYNHSEKEETFHIGLNLPFGYNSGAASSTITVAPLSEGKKVFTVKIPDDAEQGVQLITANVKYKDWELKEWCESVLEIISL